LREIQGGTGFEQHVEVVRAALDVGDLNPEGLGYTVDLGLQEIHIPVIDKDLSPVLDTLYQVVVQGVDRMRPLVKPVVHSCYVAGVTIKIPVGTRTALIPQLAQGDFSPIKL